MEDLEGAYTDALNSSGSALKENENQLDSIQGRITLFTNSVQTMWMNLLNTDVIKGIVDLGTGLVKLLDTIGLIPTALAGVVFYFTAIKKNNPVTIFNDLTNGIRSYTHAVEQIKAVNSTVSPLGSMTMQQFNAGPVNAYAAAVSNLTAKQQAATLAANGLNSEQIKSVMTANGVTAENIKLAMSEAQVAQARTNNTSVTALQVLTAMQQKNVAMSQQAQNFLLAHSTEVVTKSMLAKGVAQGLITHQDAVLILKSGMVTAANYTQALSWKALGTAMKAAFMSNPVGMILMLVSVGASLISWLGDVIDTTEKAADAANEAIDKYQEAQDTLKSSKRTISEISGDYEKLAKGVDELGNNVSLSTSEYERYNEIVNQIADMFPTMVKGYTDEGNAIIKNKGSVEALTKAYAELQEQANAELLLGGGDIMQNYKNTMQGSFWQWDRSTSNSIKAAKELENIFNNAGTFAFGRFDREHRDNFYDDIVGLLNGAGIERGFSEKNSEYVKRAVTEFPSIVQGIINSWNATANAAVSQVKPLVSAYLDTSLGYAGLTSEQKNMVDAIAADFDAEFFNKFGGDASKMYAAIETIISNIKSAGLDDDFSTTLDVQTKFNNGEVTYDEYMAQIGSFVAILDKLQADGYLDAETVASLKVFFDIQPDGKNTNETLLNSAQELLNAEGDALAGTLTKSDLEIVDKYKQEWLDLYGAEMPLEQLKELIREVREEAGEFSVSNMIDGVNTVQSAFSKLGDAYDDFTENGIVTAEALADIQESFGKVDGFDDFIAVLGNSNSSIDDVKAALSGLATEYLNASGVLDDLTEENEQFVISQLKAFGVTNAEEYIADIRAVQAAMAEQYGIDLSNYATVEGMKQAISAELYNSITSIEDDKIEAFAKKYGVDLSNFSTVEKQKTAIALAEARKQAEITRTTAEDTARQEANATMNATTVQKGEIKGSGLFGTGFLAGNKLVGMSYEDVRAAYDNGEYDNKSWKSNVESWLNSVSSVANQSTSDALAAAQATYDETMANLDDIEAKYNALDEYVAQYTPTLSINPIKLNGPDDSNSKDKSDNEFKETFDWIEVAIEEINKDLDVMTAKLENAVGITEKNNIVDNLIGGYKEKLGALETGILSYRSYAQTLLDRIPEEWRTDAQNGAMGITEFAGDADEKTVDAIKEYREWAQKVADAEAQIEATKTEISDLSKQKFDNVATEYENRISLIEAENSSLETNLDLQEGQIDASKAAYDEMIANSKEMLGALEQEAIALQAVLDNEVAIGNIKVGSDDWYEMKNTIEETKNAADECRVSLEDLELDKFNLVAKDYENQIDLLESANDQLEAQADLLEDQGYEQVNAQYDQMIANTSEMKRKLEEESVALKELLNSGTIPKYSEEWYEMQNTISDVDAAIIDCTASLEEFAQNKLDAITNQFENIIGEVETLNDSLQAQIDLQEEQGKITSPIYYEEMIKNTEQIKKDLEEQKTAMQDTLDAEVAKGNIEVGDDSWYEWIEAISKIDAEIAGCTLDIEKFNNAINDIHWDNFDELIKRYGYVKDEAQNLIDIMSDDDMFITPENEDGWGSLDVKWTDEGLATIGLYAQQMEIAERTSQEYAEAIEELKRQYDEGRYSESEYLERLNELKNGQYENIEAYQDAKDAIVDLNKERIDAVKDGIQKQIDAYEELISKQKEELDSEKDLYDFQKNVADQQKNIADIERKLSALSLDNSASARAQKAKLEAELYEAKATLEETYYDRSISNQQDALDKELEDFTEEKNAEIEKWDKYLEDVETIIAESLTNVQLNADATYVALKEKAGDYDVALSTAIQKPWEDAATKALSFADVYPKLEEKANEYGMTLAQFLATPWEQAKESPIYQELFNELDAIAQQYGFDLRGYISNGWNSGEDAISSYDGVFANSASGTIKQLDDIKNQWKLVTDQINLAAAAEVEYLKKQKEAHDDALKNSKDDEKPDNKESNNNNKDNTTGNDKPNDNNKNSTNNTQSSATPARDDKEHYGVALAIWNGNHGWGTGEARVKNLTAKGFDAKKIQDIVNQMGVDGAVHTNEWKRKYGITDLSPYHFNKYAKGSIGVKKDQIAIIDELGDELQLIPNGQGRLEYIKKGTGIVPADMTQRLMDLAMNPQEMLDRNRPQIAPSKSIVNTEISIDCSVGTMVNIEHCDQSTLPDVEKIVNKAFDKHMQTLNNSIRKFAR
jgi:hypothetical protein